MWCEGAAAGFGTLVTHVPVCPRQEQIGAVSNLRAALHKAGISPDNPRSRSQLSRRVVVLSQQVAELRRRLGTSRASGAASEDTEMNGDDAPALDHVPVFVSGDEVMTPYGPGVVLAQRDNDAMCSVRLTWGATVYATPADVRLREPQDNVRHATVSFLRCPLCSAPRSPRCLVSHHRPPADCDERQDQAGRLHVLIGVQ